MRMSPYFVGVDVGTNSVRAALVDEKGGIRCTRVNPIHIWSPRDDFYQQSSDNIWQACCRVIRDVVSEVDVNEIKGLGFDATCSLVVLDKKCQPLTISPSGEQEQNIIMWLDHRAEEQARLINEKQHPILNQYGGKISLEQNPSKILWLKQNMGSEWWNRVGHFFDLPDFLTWRATGNFSRSLCSLVCKLAYECNDKHQGWNKQFWEDVGLEELLDEQAQKLGNVVQSPGQPCGNGLSVEAANELGLKAGVAVATSMIDAHCGAIGLLGCEASVDKDNPVTSRLALICGTSTCHMAISENAHYVGGVWGPLYSALLPQLWLNEGGQSATGKLIDHLINSHPATKLIMGRLSNDRHVQEELNSILNRMQQTRRLESVAFLTENFHVWPDFHGNRSPMADPSLKGMISGLTLSNSEEDLAILYLAAMQSLAYGTRHILEAMMNSGYLLKSVLICGGLSKNPVFVQMHADITGLPVIAPNEPESVLLGGGILGATAAGHYSSLQLAMQKMGGRGKEILPNLKDKRYHDKKYEVFLKMVEHQKLYEAIMKK